MHDDDRLIQAVRDRAYDPACRLDDALVPEEWLRCHRPELDSDRLWEEFRANSSMGDSLVLPAGAWPAVAYFQDAPR